MRGKAARKHDFAATTFSFSSLVNFSGPRENRSLAVQLPTRQLSNCVVESAKRICSHKMQLIRSFCFMLHFVTMFRAACGLPFLLLGFHVSWAGDIYVSPAGSDSWPGTAEQPASSLHRAAELVREIRRENPSQSVTVWIAEGDYLQGQPLVLGPEDSGTAQAPVVWRAMENARPRLLGARKLTAGDFHPITDPATLARLAPDAVNHVLEADAVALGLENLGPYPDVFTDTGGILSLFTAEDRLPLSRFPNRGFMTIRKIHFNAGGATDGNWNGAAWHILEDHPTGGIFEYRDEFAEKHT